MTFLLDTNVISDILRKQAAVLAELNTHTPAEVAMSCVSEGELLYGIANNPQATTLHQAVHTVIKTIRPFPWDSEAAACYGRLKAELRRSGRMLSELDMMIEAQALAANLCLVTSDAAFAQVAGLTIADWRQVKS